MTKLFDRDRNYFKNKVIFISGGTGTFGTNFLKNIIENKIKVKKLIIFSRDELKQSKLKKVSCYKI